MSLVQAFVFCYFLLFFISLFYISLFHSESYDEGSRDCWERSENSIILTGIISPWGKSLMPENYSFSSINCPVDEKTEFFSHEVPSWFLIPSQKSSFQ
jgi:hypothetical protein